MQWSAPPVGLSWFAVLTLKVFTEKLHGSSFMNTVVIHD